MGFIQERAAIKLVALFSFIQTYTIMNKELEKIVEHITEMQHKLYSSENNLQYIKRLQALKYWLLRFDELLDNRLTGE